MEWISVNDKLPDLSNSNKYGKYSQPVLTLHSDGHHEDCTLQESVDFEGEPYWCYVQDDDWCETVTHWMPLPEPPKTTP